MAGIIKKLYHPQTNGTVTTASTPELQELYPITATSAVFAPNEAPSGIRNKNLDQILAEKQDVLVSGTNIKTINGQSILGSGNITIEGGGGGGGSSTLDQYLGFDAEAGAVYVKNNYGFYSNSFISAGGVGSGSGGGGGNGNATSIQSIPVTLTSLAANQGLIYNGTAWVNEYLLKKITVTKTGQSPVDIAPNSSGAINLVEGSNITFTVNALTNTIEISSTGGGGGLPAAGSGLKYGTGAAASTLSVKLASNSNLAFNTNGELYCSISLSEYVTTSALSSTLSDYVTLNTIQTITALKTFTDGITIGQNGIHIYYTSSGTKIVVDGNLQVNGNFYATGAVTAGA